MNCTAIRVYKLKSFIGVPVPKPPTAQPNVDFYVELDVVGKVEKNIELVYDEGETRVIRRDVTMTFTAVIGDETYDGIKRANDTLVNPGISFSEKLTQLTNFLSQQGLAIDLNAYPDPFVGAINADYYDYPNLGQRYNHAGWLVDNHNGPRPLSINYDDISGSTNVILTWSVKFSFSQLDDENVRVGSNQNFASLPNLADQVVKPKLSSELRFDIDEDGDIVILYAGTIYADNPDLLYKARDWLVVVMSPANTTKLVVQNREQLEQQGDLFAQYNGFKKKVLFNIDKTGRSAKFTITYSQIKSNNAYPLGIRDIEFDQELESSLEGGKGRFAPKGFATWKHTLSGSIRIPHRMDASYAWYVIHMLVLQTLRFSSIAIRSSEAPVPAGEENDENSGGEQESAEASAYRTFGGAGSVIKVERTRTRAIPLKVKLTHQKYRRKLKFNFEFFHVCPMNKIMHSVCFLDRVNNDYQRKLSIDNQPPITFDGVPVPPPTYVPLTLSQQWLAWQNSVDPQKRFDPSQTNGINLFGTLLPHRDNAGHEILDTGHSLNMTKTVGTQSPQKLQIVTTVTDPNDADPAYTEQGVAISRGRSPVMPSIPKVNPASKNYPIDPSAPPTNPIIEPPLITVNGNREMMEVTPETSWLKYEQKYIITEKHSTVPMEALANVDKNDFTSRNLKQTDSEEYDYVGSEEEQRTAWMDENSGRPKVAASLLNPYTNAEHYGWIDRPKVDDEETIPDPANAGQTLPKFFRETYASAPSRFFVRVQGHAMRARYKIPIPSIITIAGERAIRVGEHRTELFTVGAGGDMPINVAMWDQLYTVDKSILSSDILASIETSGAEIIYS